MTYSQEERKQEAPTRRPRNTYFTVLNTQISLRNPRPQKQKPEQMNKHALKEFWRIVCSEMGQSNKDNYKEEARDSYRAKKCNL